MAKPPFAEIWSRIAKLGGETFDTITGLPFTYDMTGDAIFPSRTDYRLSNGDFETAYHLVPLSGPGKINDIVRGPSYVWAILHDRRISKGAW